VKRELVVQKYGGSSVGTIERIKKVAERVARTRAQGKDVMVVVSAMAGDTDKLLQLAHQLTEKPERREIDLLLSSGERISCALLTIALHAIGCPAASLTGRQMGLVTDSTHTRARIKRIDGARARNLLRKNHVVVVAGFQGINEQDDVTTLGRGGSDTSGVALAVALNANLCEIYTDVEGVYTADPNVVPGARKLEQVSFEEMLEMASLGAKVMQIRSVEFAMNFNMPIVVRSSFNDAPGTLICKENPNMEQPVVSGVMSDKNQAKVTVVGVPDKPGVAAQIFGALAESELSVDMIIQNVSAGRRTDISFTLPRSHMIEAIDIMKKIVAEIGADSVTYDADIAKVSIVGAGMRSHPGVAARMFRTLSAENVNILMISTSEIRVSCVIEKKHADTAMRALAREFRLDNKKSAAIKTRAKSKTHKKKAVAS
jgi:aspartate kinase